MIKLEDVLKIPTYTGCEDLMIEFIRGFCLENNLEHYLDSKNNIYVTKGELCQDSFYPCVVAHTDTVHRDQEELILSGNDIKIKNLLTSEGKTKLIGWNPISDVPTGIGGDDKCGIYICLKLLLELDTIKAVFFVEEETGMHGSKIADKNFFKDVGYAIQFDAPTNNWFSRTLLNLPLWNEGFLLELQPILESNKVDNISTDPFTDVYQLRKKFDFCCAVFPTGYYNQHTRSEYVIPEETEQCYLMGLESIKKLGLVKYKFN